MLIACYLPERKQQNGEHSQGFTLGYDDSRRWRGVFEKS